MKYPKYNKEGCKYIHRRRQIIKRPIQDKVIEKTLDNRVYNFISLTNKGKKFTIDKILKNGEI